MITYLRKTWIRRLLKVPKPPSTPHLLQKVESVVKGNVVQRCGWSWYRQSKLLRIWVKPVEKLWSNWNTTTEDNDWQIFVKQDKVNWLRVEGTSQNSSLTSIVRLKTCSERKRRTKNFTDKEPVDKPSNWNTQPLFIKWLYLRETDKVDPTKIIEGTQIHHLHLQK